MTRDELIRQICDGNRPHFVMSPAAGETILEIVENELALNGIRSPWVPEPEPEAQWKPGEELFDGAYKALSNHELNPEQVQAFLKLARATATRQCQHCHRAGLKLEGEEYGVCWYHRGNKPKPGPPGLPGPYPAGTRYGLLKRSNLEDGDG